MVETRFFLRIIYTIVMFKIKIFKLKKGKYAQWRNWCNELQRKYKDESLKTIMSEENLFEGMFLFRIDNEYYTIGIAEGAFAAVDPSNELNQLHFKQKVECLAEEVPVEKLYKLVV